MHPLSGQLWHPRALALFHLLSSTFGESVVHPHPPSYKVTAPPPPHFPWSNLCSNKVSGFKSTEHEAGTKADMKLDTLKMSGAGNGAVCPWLVPCHPSSLPSPSPIGTEGHLPCTSLRASALAIIWHPVGLDPLKANWFSFKDQLDFRKRFRILLHLLLQKEIFFFFFLTQTRVFLPLVVWS